MSGSTALAQRQTPLRSTSTIAVQARSSSWWAGAAAGPTRPALFDQHADRAELLAAARDRRVDLALVAHVDDRRARRDAQRPAAPRGLLELLARAERIRAFLDLSADIGDEDRRSGAGEGERRGPSDAARRAGDEDDWGHAEDAI